MSLKIDNIINQYQSKVYTICLSYTNNVEEAEDLTQEVFINIWKGLKKFRGESNINTWIYRITVNTCLMYKRKKTKFKLFENIEEYTPHENFTDNEFLDTNILRLREEISFLNDVDKLIITLYLQELPYSSIAEIIGISLNHVGVKINRIKKHLSKKLK